MNQNRRLDQLEPLMADVLQKVDRLIEGQGQLVEIATRADHNADTAARGVANLTITVQQGFAQIEQKFDAIQQDMANLKVGQEQILQILREKLS